GTRWVRTLRAAGVRAQDGREVLVQQGAAAFSRFFPDRAAPVEVMRAAVDRALRAERVRPAAVTGRVPAVPRPAPVPRFPARRVRRLPPPLASGSRPVVRALRSAGAAVRPLPPVRRLAGRAGARPFRGLARRGRARRGTRAQVPRAAAHRRRSGVRDGVARSAGARSRLARAGATRARAAARARLQPERLPGARPEPALESARGGAARADTRHRHPNGVDTRGAAGERGGGLRIADWRLRIAD